MSTPLRVLIVEDVVDDAELMLLHLTAEGFQPDWTRVQTEADYLDALAAGPDLILADWSLPQFSGLRALRLMRARDLDIPFIIVSGSIGEEAAIDALHEGAYDYVLKDRPARLGLAARRALAEKELRQERIQAQQALQRAFGQLQELEFIVNRSPAIAFLWRAAEGWPVEFVSENIAQFGYTSEDLTSGRIPYASMVHPDDLERVVSEVAQYTQAGRADFTQEYRIIDKSGEVRWLHDSTWIRRDSRGGVTHYQGIVVDITERKQAEDEIRRRAAQQTALNAIIAAAAGVSDVQSLLEMALDHTLTALGLKMGAIWVRERADDPPALRAVRGFPFSTGHAMGHEIAAAAHQVQMPPGELLAVGDWHQAGEPWAVIAPVMSSLGIAASITAPVGERDQPLGQLSVAAPQPRAWTAEEVALVEAVGRQLAATIQRLQLLEQVQRQAAQLQQLINTVPEGVLLLDATGCVLLANPRATSDLAALAGATVGDRLTHLGDRPLAELLTPPPKGRWHEAHGDGRIFEIIARPITADSDPRNWVLVLRDVTREREIQQRALQGERLAAVGHMAAGIAHDFNNILAVIALQARLAMSEVELPAGTSGRLATISSQSQRAADLVKQILDFGRQAVLERRPVALRPFLAEQIGLLARTLPESIALELSSADEECVVNADPTRLQQAIMNLAVNARDAMPAGGSLRFALEHAPALPADLRPSPTTDLEEAASEGPATWVRLTVADTGTGIPPEALPHIFEPFFTTKGPGKGSGLGLAQVHGIVKQHGGEIGLSSEVGVGTTFAIYLPALAAQPAARPAITPVRPAAGGGETILIVEDDQTLREALTDIVELLGYRTLGAANGREALALLTQHDEIALILSDLVMPELGGRALLQEVKSRGLTTPVVILSGHPLDNELASLQALGLAGWLLKPPEIEQLARVLAQALGRP